MIASRVPSWIGSTSCLNRSGRQLSTEFSEGPKHQCARSEARGAGEGSHRHGGGGDDPVEEIMSRAFLGLGSNLGDRLASLRSACGQIDSLAGTHIVRASRLYETEPF